MTDLLDKVLDLPHQEEERRAALLPKPTELMLHLDKYHSEIV
jgi:hypothetical protein